MALIRFTDNIQRHVPCPAKTLAGASVREVLNAYFADNEAARGYVLDDLGGLRSHMNIFVNGTPIRDRAAQSDAIEDDASIDVMQALSGG